MIVGMNDCRDDNGLGWNKNPPPSVPIKGEFSSDFFGSEWIWALLFYPALPGIYNIYLFTTKGINKNHVVL